MEPGFSRLAKQDGWGEGQGHGRGADWHRLGTCARRGRVPHARVVVCHTARSPLRDEGTLTRREHPRGAASALEAQKRPRWGRESRRKTEGPSQIGESKGHVATNARQALGWAGWTPVTLTVATSD